MIMHVSRAAILAASVLLSFAAAANDTVSLPVDDTLTDSTGAPAYVSDAVVVSTVPWLHDAGARIWSCYSAFVGNSLHVLYVPTMTGPHAAIENSLSCQVDPAATTTLRCLAPPADRAVVFDDKPEHYFRLGKNTDIDAARALFHALINDEVEFTNGVKKLRLNEPNGFRIYDITRHGTTFSVGFSDCGCSGKVEATRDGDKGKDGKWRVTRAGPQLCA